MKVPNRRQRHQIYRAGLHTCSLHMQPQQLRDTTHHVLRHRLKRDPTRFPPRVVGADVFAVDYHLMMKSSSPWDPNRAELHALQLIDA